MKRFVVFCFSNSRVVLGVVGEYWRWVEQYNFKKRNNGSGESASMR